MVVRTIPGPLEAIQQISILVQQEYGWNHVLNTLPVTIIVFLFVFSFSIFVLTTLSLKKHLTIASIIAIYILQMVCMSVL